MQRRRDGVGSHGCAAAAAAALPGVWTPRLTKIRDLRYGENPHQPAAWYARRARRGFGGAHVVHQGKELSFTNLLDLDAAARIALEFDRAGRGRDQAHQSVRRRDRRARSPTAYVRAREADALSAFGGIVGLNRPIDLDTARALTSTFIEAVIAPGIVATMRSAPCSATKPNLRVVTASFDGLAIAARCAVDSRRLARAGARPGDRGRRAVAGR